MGNKNSFKFLWIGQTLANIGDVLYIIGLMPLLYHVTGSAFLMALVPFVSTFSRFLSALIAPVLFKKLSLKDILVWSQSAKTVVYVALLLFVYFFFSDQNIFLIYLVVFLLGFLDGLASPASSSLVPKLVENEKLLKSNSWLESISQFIEIATWPLGGILVLVFDTTFVLILTSILYIIATIILKMIYVTKPLYEDTAEFSLFSEAKKGWVYISKRKDLLNITLASSLISSANIVWLASIMYVYIEEILGVSTVWWGYINSLLVLGLFIGSLITLIWSSKVERHFTLISIIMTLLMTVSTLLLSINAIPVIAITLAFIFGFSSQLKGLLEVTYIQYTVDGDNLPYVYSAQEALYLFVFSISILVFSYLIDKIGIILVLGMASFFLFLSFIIWVMNKNHFLNIVDECPKENDTMSRKWTN